jgi:hypothetical protein
MKRKLLISAIVGIAIGFLLLAIGTALGGASTIALWQFPFWH